MITGIICTLLGVFLLCIIRLKYINSKTKRDYKEYKLEKKQQYIKYKQNETNNVK